MSGVSAGSAPTGPFAGGAPPDALVVDYPPIERFGVAEVRRALLAAIVLIVELVKSLPAFVRGGRPRSAVLADAVVNGFEQMGPTFVKLGQLIASSPGMFPPTLATACRRTLDRVMPIEVDYVRAVIAEDLGRDPDEAFASFDPVPLSAASIAQVHACTLHDGRHAVVKVQRPGLTEQMNTDLRILYRVARLAARSKHLKMANPVAVITDLHQVTNQELNFALEADRQSRFRANLHAFGDNLDVTAPTVYWELCGPRVICMERLYGTPVDRYDGDPATGQRLLREAVKAWLEAACVHGPFHGDLHAGNLWILDDGRIAFLDFGIMGELDDEWRVALLDILRALIVDQDFVAMARTLQRTGILPATQSPEEVGAQLSMVLVPLLDSTLVTVPLGQLIQLALSTAGELGGVAAAELVLIGKQILYVERYITHLAPDWLLARDTYITTNLF
jgi:predicted unusual protein kinase regulating ubiquinone biosynthesis (AarF/ABC1/UbiB family)